MRILSLSNCPLERNQGSGYVITAFRDGLCARGHQVDLAGPEETILFPWMQKARSRRIALGMALSAWKRMRTRSYDVVELFGEECWLAASMLHRVVGRSYLLVHHSNGIEPLVCERMVKHLGGEGLDGGPLRWHQRCLAYPRERAFTHVDGLVTVSQYDARYAHVKGYLRPERVQAVSNAVASEYLGRPFVAERQKLITYCGGWLAIKGSRVMQTDLTRVLREFPDWRIRLIGVGDLFDTHAYFPAEVLPRIEVVPFEYDRVKLRAMYEETAIAVQPSVYESFGLAAAEAMACGAAVVAVNTGFPAELRDREEVLLMVDPGSPHLYEPLRELTLNEPLRVRVARGGWKRAQDLRWEDSIDLLEETYTRWLDEHRQSPRVPELCAPLALLGI